MKLTFTVFRRIKQCINYLREGARKVLRCLPMYDKTFKRQLKRAKTGEYLVKNVLSDYGYESEFTSLDKQHKGDLLVRDCCTNDTFYVEVKQDTRIGDTKNVYIELEIQRPTGKQKGWYYSDYSKLAVVDATVTNPTRTKKPLFLIDWETMKSELSLNDKRCKQYKHGTEDGNTCTALLVPLRYIQSKGWLQDTYYYDESDWTQAKREAKAGMKLD